MCWITGNTKLGKNGFSNANATMEWGNDVKDVITKDVTATIEHKDNDHALALTEMRTTKEYEL